MTDEYLNASTGKVSIIMPCYNCERYVEAAITSVVAQSYRNWELIICDDGSTDLSRNIAQRYVGLDPRIKLIDNHHSKGAPGARNSCLDYATGRYIAFLDADDLWYPEKLSRQVQFMTRCSIDFCFSYQDVMNENGSHLLSVKAPRVVTKKKMRIANFIPCVTAVYDAHSLGKVYQPNIRKRNDYALWLVLLEKTDAVCLDAVLGCYRSNSYGLASGGILELTNYYIRCMRDFAGCSRLSLVVRIPIYLTFMLLKKFNSKIFNWVVIRL